MPPVGLGHAKKRSRNLSIFNRSKSSTSILVPPKPEILEDYHLPLNNIEIVTFVNDLKPASTSMRFKKADPASERSASHYFSRFQKQNWGTLWHDDTPCVCVLELKTGATFEIILKEHELQLSREMTSSFSEFVKWTTTSKKTGALTFLTKLVLIVLMFFTEPIHSDCTDISC